MKNIDDIIDYESEYKKYLNNPKKNKDSLMTRCPFHDDDNPSFSVNLKNGMYHCFGCNEQGNLFNFISKMEDITTNEAYKGICEKYNIEYIPESKIEKEVIDDKYDILIYSKDKGIPLNYLEKTWKISNFKKVIKIPYMDEEEKVVSNRFRGINKSFRWEKNAVIIPYGLQLLSKHKNKDYLILVEGESDTQSLELVGHPALGIPGATTFKSTWIKYLKGKKVYIHNENDIGGNIFKDNICRTLEKFNYKNKVYEFSCSDYGVKDPNELFQKYVALKEQVSFDQLMTFKNKITELIDKAKELDLKEVTNKANLPIEGMPNVLIPTDYEISKEGIILKDFKGNIEVICRIPVVISAILKNLESDLEDIELSYYDQKSWKTIITTRSIINNSRLILQLGDMGIMISGENAKKMSSYFGKMDDLNYGRTPVRNCVAQLGWWGKYFIPHVSGDIFLKNESSNKKLITGYEPRGSYEAWVKEIKPLLKNDLFNCVLKTSFAAPLIKLLDYRTFIVHVWANSRAGKTAALKVALSVWGNPDDIMGTFNSTAVGFEKMAAFYNDLPFGIDEKQVSGSNKDYMNNIVYMLGLGQGRTRGSKSGGIQERVFWRTAVITTGEEPISSENSQTGISTRVIELYGKLFEEEKTASHMHRFSVENCGYVGKKYIEHIIDNYLGSKKLKEIYNNILMELEDNIKNNISSHISSVGIICLADYISNKVIFEIDDLKQSINFGKRILELLEKEREADIVEKAYTWLKSWVLVNLNYFSQMSKTLIYGFREKIDNKNYFFIQPSILQNELIKQGYNYRKTLKGFRERGYLLIEDSQNRNTVRRTNSLVTTTYVAIMVEENFSDLSEEEADRIEKREFDECSELEWIAKQNRSK